MSCACEQKKMGRDRERIIRLAKGYARMENVTVAIYKNADGTFGFSDAEIEINREIIEYITPY